MEHETGNKIDCLLTMKGGGDEGDQIARVINVVEHVVMDWICFRRRMETWSAPRPHDLILNSRDEIGVYTDTVTSTRREEKEGHFSATRDDGGTFTRGLHGEKRTELNEICQIWDDHVTPCRDICLSRGLA
jgi:hypothetical protein